MRPGIACEAIDAAARRPIEAEGFGEAFFHRTGHGIGLEGHEEPYIIGGNPEPLREGMAFSIEPGIYLPGVVRRPDRGHRDLRLRRPDRAQCSRRTSSTSSTAEAGGVRPPGLRSGGLRYHRATGRARCAPSTVRDHMITTSRRPSGAVSVHPGQRARSFRPMSRRHHGRPNRTMLGTADAATAGNRVRSAPGERR